MGAHIEGMKESGENDKKERKQEVITGEHMGPEVEFQTGPQLVPISNVLPKSLFLLPVNQTIVFPGMMVPIILSQEKHADTIEFLKSRFKKSDPSAAFIGITILKDPTSDSPIKLESLAEFGVAGRILKHFNLPDGSLSILVNCLKRFRVRSAPDLGDQIIANVEYLEDVYFGDTETEALARTVINQFKIISQNNPLVSEEMKLALVNIDGPGKLSDLLAAILIREVPLYIEFLKTLDVRKRLEMLLTTLKKELDVHNLQSKMSAEINKNVSKQQREYFLKEQLKLIQKELGQEKDEKSRAEQKFRERLSKIKLSEEAQKKFDEEIEKLNMLSENSPEFGVTYNYLDWITSLPWGVSAPENSSLKKAKEVLEADHFGLDDVKRRILEIIAVHQLKKDKRGSIILLVGPPGVGKTSLGKSIARALDRPFYRFSVGGMRDEAEIKGHRRTYIGSMPGKVIQGLKSTGVDNPVFMVDEIDKLGSDFRGDPASSLLEVLDPEQNQNFQDHYMDLRFDVSHVLFVATANQLDSIPAPLLDRMEVIRIPGYITDEKLKIAENHIIPKVLEKNGLKSKQLIFSQASLRTLIEGYARESGVRSLEKCLDQISRKFAVEFLEKKSKSKTIQPTDIEKYLGQPIFSEAKSKKLSPGVTVGLAWTAMGGDTLFIESLALKSADKGLKLTGQMGEVMTESANIAWSYVRKLLSQNKKVAKNLDAQSIHIHIPAGAVPKDGPSAGVTLASSLYGLLTNQRIKDKLAMTGELTLTGDVLAVGGIREKVVAAKRNGIKEIILPKANKRDIDEIPTSVKKGLKFHLVSKMDQVLKLSY